MDEELARAALEGDERAVEELFDRHSGELRAWVRRRLPAVLRRKVAESDVIQEAYLGAYLNLGRFEGRGEGSFRRWLATILDRRIKQEIRHHLGTQKRGVEQSAANSAEGPMPVAEDPSPSGRAMTRESHARVRAAVRQLSEDHQTILRLVHDEHCTLADAAERMGRSKEAVRKLYGRATTRLAELLGEGEG